MNCELNDASVFTIRVDRMAGKKPRVVSQGWVDLMDRYGALKGGFFYLVPLCSLLTMRKKNAPEITVIPVTANSQQHCITYFRLE